MAGAIEIHTHEFYPKQGGIGRYCHEFARGAADQGWKVTVHGPNTANFPPNDTSKCYQLESGQYGPSHGPINLLRSRKQLATVFRDRPDSLHLLVEPGPILACGLLPVSIFPKRLQLVLHGSEVERWASLSGMGFIAKRTLERASRIIVPSQGISNRLQAAYPQLSSRDKVVPHALPHYFRSIAESISAREDIQNTSKLRLLSVGRIHPRKGFDQVLQAITQLSPKEKSSLQYTIAGSQCNTDYEKQLHALAKGSGCSVKFCFNPDDATLAELYRASNLFALTSMERGKSVEGFGLVYLEAAAFGLPSLAYKTGGVEAAIIDTKTGHLLPTGKIDGLTQKLRSFIEEPEKCIIMGRYAQKAVLARNWSQVAQESLG